MNPKEQEIAIKELEERVDRLRNIYEQYFLGFEKLEPTVPRKDVDRRFALLRKEQIRNTAVRFRFNVVTQKYNTYSTHWIRICRQIEEGTYKRHIRRAKARFGDTAAAPEHDISIDIDMGDFDDMEMDGVLDEVLAEANAAAESYERDAPDTVPPPPSAPPVAPPPPDRAAPASPPDRAARPAALPAGAKPRVVLRKRDESDLSLTARTSPGVAPATTATPREGGSPPMGSPPGTRPMAAPPTETSPAAAYANPLGPAPRRPTAQVDAGQAGTGHAGTGHAGTFATGAGTPRPGTPRIAPVAPPSGANVGARANAPAPPGVRAPVAAAGTAVRPAPSAGRVPAAAALPTAASSGRLPTAGPLPAPSSAGRIPGPAPLPAPSAGRLPLARPSGATLADPSAGGAPSPNAAPRLRAPAGQALAQPQRPPTPSITEKDEQDTIPPPPPSNPARIRAPLPLPSQIVRPPPKKD